jgi:hypothetical protein
MTFMLLASLMVASLLSRVTGSSNTQIQSSTSITDSNQIHSSEQVLTVGGAKIEVEFRLGDYGLGRTDVLDWVKKAAEAVTVYYGAFPVQHARIIVIQTGEDNDSIHGTTWGNIAGVQALSRMRLGREVTRAYLDADWTMTHELVHMALSSLPDESHWLEEGLATYVEPIARAQAGQLPISKVWGDMVIGMPRGEPENGDHGLDQTHTWGRTYWGGAMFCLMSDIKIRQATHNQKGLEDALRAIAAQHATIDTEWPLRRVLKTGDQATGTTVMSDLYQEWKDKPVSVDLAQLWHQLGVISTSHGVEFDSSAPLAPIREAIARPSAK